jgi:hypothetical protein
MESSIESYMPQDKQTGHFKRDKVYFGLIHLNGR